MSHSPVAELGRPVQEGWGSAGRTTPSVTPALHQCVSSLGLGAERTSSFSKQLLGPKHGRGRGDRAVNGTQSSLSWDSEARGVTQPAGSGDSREVTVTGGGAVSLLVGRSGGNFLVGGGRGTEELVATGTMRVLLTHLLPPPPDGHDQGPRDP